MKIQTKLLIGIFGGMLSVYLIAFLFQQNHSMKEVMNLSAQSRSAEEANLWQWVERLQFAIRSPLMEFMAAGEMEMFDKTITSQRNVAGLQEFSLYDADGKMVNSTEQDQKGKVLAADRFQEIRQSLKPVKRLTDTSLEVYEPLLAEKRCLKCHESWKEGQLTGVMAMRFSSEALKASEHTWKSYEQSSRKSNLIFSTITALGLLFSVGFVTILAVRYLVASPIKVCVETMDRLAKGDFSRDMPEDFRVRKDEFGELATAINTTTRDVRNILSEMAMSARELKETAVLISESSSAQAAGAKESALQSHTVATAGEELAVNSKSMAASTSRINASTVSVAAAVEEMSSSINEVSENCANEAQIATRAAQQARSTRDVINRQAGAAKQIDNIVTLIARLAQQTNLLSLNATIEAASAGEAGRGFAVVAHEVKELAKQSAAATEEIRKQIADIQKDTTNSTGAIDEVVQVIEQVNQIALNIASAVEEQSATAAEISRSLQNITSSTEELAHNVNQSTEGASEVSRNIQGVSTSISNTANGAARQEAGTKGLLALSATLSAIVGHFKIETDDTDTNKSPAAKELANELKKAMVAHGAWKQRLRTVIATGKSTFQLEDVRKDNCCDFGRWLYACEGNNRRTPHWECVRDLHATFHREAAEVLQEATDGDPGKATEAITSADSPFRTASDKLSKAIVEWSESNP